MYIGDTKWPCMELCENFTEVLVPEKHIYSVLKVPLGILLVAAIVFILGFQRFVCVCKFHQKVIHKASSALKVKFPYNFAFLHIERCYWLICKGACFSVGQNRYFSDETLWLSVTFFLIFESHFLVLCSLLFLIIIIMSVAKLFHFPQGWLETWEIQANIKSWFPDQTTWTK